MSYKIRAGRPTDGPSLYHAWESIRAHDAGLDDRIVSVPVSAEDFAADFAGYVGRQDAAAFIATEGNRIGGFVTCRVELAPADRIPERHVTIGYLFVDPGSRRQGLGRKLFDAVATWAAGQGVDHLEMTVLAANREAADFWRALGFSPFIERLWAPLPGHHG